MMRKSKKPKILYLCSYLDEKIAKRYGTVSHYSPAGLKKKKGIVKSLSKIGFDTFVVSPIFINTLKPRFFKRWEYEDKKLGINVYFPNITTFFPFNTLYLIISTIMESIKLRNKYKFDTIIFYNYRFEVVIPAVFIRLLYKTPIIIQYEDGLFDAPNKFTAIISSTVEHVFKKLLNGAILNNLNFKERILTNNYCVIRGFVDGEAEKNMELDINDKDKKIVMFSGQLDEVRGIDVFLEVCKGASSDEKLKTQLEFWITGYGKEKLVKDVKKETSKIDNAKYLGFLSPDQFKIKLNKADILVNLQKPSKKFSTYCFPSKIIEFMKHEKIIISTDISDINQIADEKIIITGPSPEEVIKTLRQVITNYNEFEKYAKNAKEWVLKNCTYTSSGRSLKKVIERSII